MKQFTCFAAMLLFATYCFAYKATGKVIDGQSRKPLAGAMVFINHSLNFVLTDSSGQFSLDNISPGFAVIVAACSGYQSSAYLGNGEKPEVNIRFELAPNEAMAALPGDSVSIDLQELFLQQFIGTSEYGLKTQIVNPKALHYNLNNSSAELTVTASEPVTVINESLGYMVQYLLDSIVINNNVVTQRSAHCFFKELSSKNSLVINKWSQRRQVAYMGSLSHFLRSFVNNSSQQQGFSVFKVKRIYEDEADYKSASKSKEDIVGKGSQKINGADKKFIDVRVKVDESLSAIKRTNSSNGIILSSYPETLLIKYDGRDVPQLSETLYGQPNKLNALSILFVGKDGVMVERNGGYFPAEALFVEGAMQEKLSEMLPVEYR